MKLQFLRRTAIITSVIFGFAITPLQAFAAGINTLGISYAYYDPISLVVKDNGYLQDALGPTVTINWVLSRGATRPSNSCAAIAFNLVKRQARPRCWAGPTARRCKPSA